MLKYFGVCLLLLAGCDGPGRGSHDGVEGAACAFVMQFGDGDQYSSFVGANADLLVSLAIEQRVLSVRRQNELTGYVIGSACEGASLDRDLGLSRADAHVRHRRAIDVAAIQQHLGEAREAGLRGATTQRACVVRVEALPPDAESAVQILPYVGLAGVQVERADGVTYVSADEDCSLLTSVVSSATRVTSQALHRCPLSSLRDCGYPYDLEYVE